MIYTLKFSFFPSSIFCFLLFFAGSLQGQKLDHVQGQFIVQIDADVSVKSWLYEFNNQHNFNIRVEKKVSPILNIYTVNYDFTKHNESRVHTALLLHNNVEVAQYNHFLTLRETIPNDPEFVNQWQYINMGQDGGTIGADIDMELAWDFATGGITADGDTIVACIIDDGVDANHPDITPNLFINYAEIPGNGIDDDNNGFVDDVRGWDTGSGTDAVYDGGGHGTPVTGIIGARGNDGFGVAGVNWDVKLMIVQGGTGVESEVIEAYSYPLAFRRKYNQTDGAEGAFVVSTNSSWGIDFGQPADAPLWCAFYDTLGLEGIISCGATINGNQDVDEIGDLPTACPSNYLLSVTNMNRNDEKVNGAGYGAVTIDLGAFGAATWTTSIGGGFNGFGGTSGATPHVTGTAALLYSLPCPNLIDLAKSDPAAAATLVRSAILEGVDFNESLQGITTTGGRLNVNNSMEILLQNHCGDCLAPFVESTTIIEDGTAEISFTLNDTTEFVEMRFREVGATDWIDAGNISSPYAFNNIELCTNYEFQLRSICTNSEGEYGITRSFESFGCCINPDLPVVTETNETNAIISWIETAAATSYNIRYKEVGANMWNYTTSDAFSIELTDLNPCTNYEVQIQSDCILESPEYSEAIHFFTLGCIDPCVQLPYCSINGYNSSEEWIGYVKIANLENETGANAGYGDFTDFGPTTDLMVNGLYQITVNPIFEGNDFDEYFNVWIDLNHNGEFEDDTELMVSQGPVTEQIEEVFSIPAGAVMGNARMRVAMRYNTSPFSCTEEDFNDFGEVEDYCVNIVPFSCMINQSVDTVEVESDQSLIAWDEDLNIETYEYRYKDVTSSVWTEGTTEINEVLLENLNPCTEYEFQLKSICPEDESEFGESFTFSTNCLSNNLENEFENISIYPNPTNNSITLDLSTIEIESSMRLTVINQLGEIILQKQIEENINTLDLNDIASGMYYIQLQEQENIIYQSKIVKY